MVVEEVRYDFADYPKYADDFVRDLLKLMIISKMNSTARNNYSRAYFQKLVSQMEGCETNVVKYGQPLLYVKYRGVEFTDQKVTSQFIRSKGHVIDVTMESVFGDFVKTFDNLASMSESRVKWGIGGSSGGSNTLSTADSGLEVEKDSNSSSKTITAATADSKKSNSDVDKNNNKNQQLEPDPMFALLDRFVDAVWRLTSLDPQSPNSLAGKRFGMRNASIFRKSFHLEFLIDGFLHIIELNPAKKKDKAVDLLFGNSEEAKAIVALMKQ